MFKLKPLRLIIFVVVFVSGCQQLDQIVINDVNNLVENIKTVPKRLETELIKEVPLSQSDNQIIKILVKPLKEVPLIPIKPKVFITFSEPKIVKPIKPKVKINFTYIEPYYKFNHYSDNYFISPLINTTSLIINPLNIKNLKTSEISQLLGRPDFIREEANIVTWQYRNQICVLDFFLTKDTDLLNFTDIRSRTYGESLNIMKCMKSFNQRILFFNGS